MFEWGRTFGAAILFCPSLFCGRPCSWGRLFLVTVVEPGYSLSHPLGGKWFVQGFLCGGSDSFSHPQWGRGSLYCLFTTEWHWPEGVPLIIFPPCLGELYSSGHLCGAQLTLLGEAVGLHPARPFY